MKAFIEAIEALTATMQRTVSGNSETEARVLDLLMRLQFTADSTSSIPLLAPDMDRLHHLWTHSVDWCSNLSRQLEKIIILYQEELQSLPEAPTPKKTPTIKRPGSTTGLKNS